MQNYKYRQEMLSFYSSKEWKQTRDNYKRMKCFICERCGRTTKKMIVHHKIYLSPMNMNIPEISLNPNNLELLCIDCHNKEHFKETRGNRYSVDECGRVTTIEAP